MTRRRRKHRTPQIHRRTPPGSMPETLAADPAARPTQMRVIAYGPDEIVDRAIERLDEIAALRAHHPVTWLNVDGLSSAERIEAVGRLFGLHGLALEDVVNTYQRAKVEAYDDHLYIVARMANHVGSSVTEQLSLFLGTGFVVTFQEEAGDCWDPVRARLKTKAGSLRRSGADALAHALLDATIDGYFPQLELLGERIERLDAELFHGSRATLVDDIHELKVELLALRRAVWPHREAFAELLRESTPFVTDGTRIYFRDCYDHVVQLIDLIETYREMASDLHDLHMSAVSHRVNETMRVLTMIATIFIPTTFVASIYGMNFKHMPELDWPLGYPFALVVMLLTAISLLWWFGRRGWLRPSIRPDHEPRSPDS